MDLLTHSAAGACIAWAWPRRWVVPQAALVAVAAALLPDADMFIDPWGDPRSGFAHRGFTHSLFGVAVLAPLIALVPLWLSKEKRNYVRLVALVAMGMLSHVLLDVMTILGAKVFYPFYRENVYVDWLSELDFTLFTLGLFALLTAWTYAHREAAVRRGILSSVLLASFCWWLFAELPILARQFGETLEEVIEEPFRTGYPLVLGGMLLGLFAAFARKGWAFRENRAVFGRIGLAAFSVYLLVCGTAHWVALSQIKQFTRERRLEVLARVAIRSEFVEPFRWTGLVLAPEGVYQVEIRPFGVRRPTFKFSANATENAFVTRSRSIPGVQVFLSQEARFPVSCYQVEGTQHIVEYYDPWYGMGVLRVALNERREVLTVRWVRIRDYISSHTAVPHSKVGPNIVSQVTVTPCFLQRWGSIPDASLK